MMINPDIEILTGSVPTFYGEVESSGSKEKTMLDKLNQVSARVLCYTNKCFSMFAQSDKIHFKFYQRDDNCMSRHTLTAIHQCLQLMVKNNSSMQFLVDPWGMMVPPTEG